jgi:general secretion pathway protein L
MASRATSTLERFLRWWADELKGLAPTSWRAGPRRQPTRMVIAVEGQRKSLLLEKGGQTETLAQISGAEEDLSEFARLIKARPKIPVGLRLGEGDCFSRVVQLPAQAEGDYRRILELDMERSTPFRAADVLTAFHSAPSENGLARGKRTVRHLVVKRRTADPLLREFHDLGIYPAFMDCWDEQRRGGLPVDFLAATRPASRARGGPGLRGLGVLAALLVASAMTIWIVRHQSALAALESRAEAARAEAGNARIAVEASQMAAARMEAMSRRLRNRLPVARIIEELTATVPDDAWISDLRIDGDTVELTGFAKSAAALVPRLENAPLFADVLLTSPVVLDNNEDKERFSMRLRLSIPGQVAARREEKSEAETAEQ